MRRLYFTISCSALIISCGSAGGFPERDAGPVRDGGPRDAGQGVDCTSQSPNMTFFFTREGARSGDLGGLAGADQICAAAAAASGSTRGGWVAYLSALDDPTFGRVNAVDRIGPGPWFNYCGEGIGNLSQIHDRGVPANMMRAEDGFTIDAENPNATLFNRAHDIFTGSDQFGMLVGGNGQDDPPQTCADWTSSSPSDTAWIGHEDTDFSSGFWNDAHPTTGCDEDSLAGTLAIGRIYCFSTDTPPPRDGGVRDAGNRDGGVRDGGFRDGGVRDGGEPKTCEPAATMSFFFTEQGSGPMGGNLGGLAGADAICQAAATTAGAGGRTWRAYLSALADATYGRVDARDRIGNGPWFNYDGLAVGDLTSIHASPTGIAGGLMKSACGFEIDAENPNADLFNRGHDIFTGSDEQGRLIGASGPKDPPQTCNDWTSSSPNDTAWIGHEDTDNPSNNGAWNSAHPTTGCDETSLAATLAIGRLYCFATD